jgi:cell division protein FtsW (lipid II flippase)
MKKNINKIDLYSRELFYVLNGAIFIFFVMELIKPRIVLAYFNLNYLLIIWVFLAIVIVSRNKQ